MVHEGTVVANRVEGRTDHSRDRLFELSLDLFCIADHDGYFLDINPAWERTLGWTRDELMSRPYTDFVHPDDLKATQAAQDRLRKGDDVVGFENRYRTRDGGFRHLTWNATLSEDGDLIYAVAHDITQRKRAEERLALLAAVTESSSDAILTIDTDHRIRTWNPGAEELFGYEPDEIIGEPLIDVLVPEERRSEAEEVLDRLLAGEPVQDHKTVRIAEDGTPIPVSTTVSPIVDDGDVVGFAGIIRDIRDRKAAEEELRLQKTLLEATLEASDEGILVVDPDGEMVAFNDRFAEMWDLSDEVLATRSDEAAIQSVLDQLEDPDEFVEKIRYLYDHPDETSRDEIRLTDGRILDRYSAPVVGNDGTRYGRVWFFRDVTEVRNAQGELQRLAGELRRSNEDLEQFAYATSHDLQEPIRMVRDAVTSLQEVLDDVDGEAEELMGHAVDGVERMRSMIDGLLEYSRAGRRSLRPEQVDADRILDEILEDLAVAIRETGATVERGDLPVVRVDPVPLRQVLQNLVANALKYHGDEPPHVRGEGEDRDGAWAFAVHDDGVGIDPDQIDRIFGPFDRLHTWQETPGSGMGLALCRKIVERWGGQIDVDTKPGRGSTFRFTIPKEDPDARR